MVKSKLIRLIALVALSAGCVLAAPAAAVADSPVGPTQRQSPDGDPRFGSTGNCAVYANASSYGLNCDAGGGGKAQTVDDLLQHQAPPACWDTMISDKDAQDMYSLPVYPGQQRWYQITCLSGLEVGQPIFDQAKVSVIQPPPISIPVNASDCKPLFSADKKVEHFAFAEEHGYTNNCVMQLEKWQVLVASYFQNNDNQIPAIAVSATPSTRIRTQVPTAYTDDADCTDCVSPTQTQTLTAGGHSMNATMTKFQIMPYGKGTTPAITCDGTADVPLDATQANDAKACWFTYTHSSGQESGRYYPFTAAATWQVNLDGAPYATFVKYGKIGLSVVDVQSLVIGQAQSSGGTGDGPG